MCWKPPYKRLKMKTDETKNIAQYVLETTIQKTQDEDRNKKHNTICVGNHHTKDSKMKTDETKNTTQYVLETTAQTNTDNVNKT